MSRTGQRAAQAQVERDDEAGQAGRRDQCPTQGPLTRFTVGPRRQMPDREIGG
jgi:hypothetical protein